jgi:hypothetical protein
MTAPENEVAVEAGAKIKAAVERRAKGEIGVAADRRALPRKRGKVEVEWLS